MSKVIMTTVFAAASLSFATQDARAAGFGYGLEPPSMLQGGNGDARGRRVRGITDDLTSSGLVWGAMLGGVGIAGGLGIAALSCDRLGCLDDYVVFPAVGLLVGYTIGVPLGVGLEGPDNASSAAVMAGVGGAVTGAAAGVGVGALTWLVLGPSAQRGAGAVIAPVAGAVVAGVAAPLLSVMFYESAYDAQFDVAVLPTFQSDGGGVSVFGRF